MNRKQEDAVLAHIESSLSMVDACSGKPVIYASTPITTGILYYDLMKNGLEGKGAMKQNTAAGVAFADQLRGSYCRTVICPAAFFASGWTQEHYMSLWETIILKFADEVYFNEGWQYSNGCTAEYLIALKNDIPRYDHRGKQLDSREAETMIRGAIDELDGCGMDISVLYGLWRSIYLYNKQVAA